MTKFVGLDEIARQKLNRAQTLHEAGFCPEPIALRYGFTIEPYHDAAPGAPLSPDFLTEYLDFRRRFLTGRPGATLVQLRGMARHNFGQIDPVLADSFGARWSERQVSQLQSRVEPVHVDARLHWWEWLVADGRVFKTDAVDHSEGHDLVGCQDILWDVAGATIELPEMAQQADLASCFAPDPERRELLAFLLPCYLAFQIGWWSLSQSEQGLAQSRLYARRAADLLVGG